MMINADKSAALAKIGTINAVEGFDPAPLAVDYTDLNTGETRKRLPVMAQIAWFRLKYPEGRFTLNVMPGTDCFVATARVYAHYNNPMDQYLSEATASRGYNPAKPTVSPREWSQTAALGIALRNAGFGLQFHAAGESFDEPAVDELSRASSETAAPEHKHAAQSEPVRPSVQPGAIQSQPEYTEAAATGESGIVGKNADVEESTTAEESAAAAKSATATEDPLEKAMKTACPIQKFSGKTLGDLIKLDPNALVWVANKFTGNPEISSAAKLICEHSLAATA